jgi:hypothetical protein
VWWVCVGSCAYLFVHAAVAAAAAKR